MKTLNKSRCKLILVAVILVVATIFLFGCNGSKSESIIITFDTQGGSVVPQVKLSAGETLSAPDAPTREGYDFLGWFYNKDATDAVNFNTFKAVSSTTIYAGWIKCEDNEHNISFVIYGEGSAKSLKVAAKLGENVKFDAYGGYGFYLESATINGEELPLNLAEGATDTYVFTMPACDVKINLYFMLDEYSITIASAEGGTITCNKQSAKMGDEITFISTPEPGYYLSLLQALTISLYSNNLTMKMLGQDIYVQPVFTRIDYSTKYTLQTSCMGDPNGQLILDKTSASIGEYVTVTAIPSEGYVLKSLTANGKPFDGSFVMTDTNTQIEAIFAPAEQKLHNIYILTEGDGTVTAQTTEAYAGKVIYLTAFPDKGYELCIVSVNSTPIANDDLSFVMPNSNVTIIVTFIHSEYEIKSQTYEGGSIYTSKPSASAGEIITFDVEVNDINTYYFIDGSVKVNGESVGNNGYFIMPESDVELTATFVKRPQGSQTPGTITIPDFAHGTVTANTYSAGSGSHILITVTPDEGYVLKSGSLNYNGYSFTDMFIMPEGNVVIGAEFERIYTISPYIGEDGLLIPSKSSALPGEVITLSAEPFSDKTTLGAKYFATKSGDATPISIKNMQFTMPSSNVVLTATFASLGATEFSISFSEMIGGAVSCNTTKASCGSKVSLKITPDSGKKLEKLWYDGTDFVASAEICDIFTMPNQNIVISATFADDEDESLQNLWEMFIQNRESYAIIKADVKYSRSFTEITKILTENKVYGIAGYISAMITFDSDFDFYAFECSENEKMAYVTSKLYEAFGAYTNSDVEVKVYDGNICLVSLLNGADDDYNILKNGLINYNNLAISSRNDGTYQLVKSVSVGESGIETLPLEYCGRAVTKICPYAYKDKGSSINTINLGNITELAPFALSGLSSITRLDLGMITKVGSGAFIGQDSLKEFAISAKNSAFLAISGILYRANGYSSTALVAYPVANESTECKVDKTCTEVSAYAFYNAKNLTKVTSGTANIKTIGKYAFYGCTSLYSISLEKAGDIGDYAFYMDALLGNIKLSSAKKLGENVFYVGSSTLTITIVNESIKSTANGADVIYISSGNDSHLEILTKYAIFDSVRSSSLFRRYAGNMKIASEDLIGTNISVIFDVPENATYVASIRQAAGGYVSKPADPVMEGYNFVGWFLDGSSTAFDFTSKVSNSIRLIAKFESAQ